MARVWEDAGAYMMYSTNTSFIHSVVHLDSTHFSCSTEETGSGA